MNRIQTYLLIVIIGLLATSCSLSDNERKMVREGNKAYQDSIFDEAEILYRKALDYNPTSFVAHYNIANTTYKQENYKEAVKKYIRLLDSLETKEWKSASLHNLGNSYLHTQKIDKAIEAYKESLRENPDDKETKYNLIYAMKLREQQQQQQQQNQNQKKQDQQDNENKQDQKSQQDNQPKDGDKETKPQPKPGEGKGEREENQEDEQKDKKKQDNQESGDQKDGEKGDDERENNAPEPSDSKEGNPDENGEKQLIPVELSKEEAEDLLDAIAVEEKESQEKVQKDKTRKKGRVKKKKNW
ncbi:tetratricopeptide repeat protein [Balneicella halophila]|uniref:Tetratricopeptide repeat protein n=1 Tax=Balneicella halophila TaxID=1537566 RepID=A0A7L4USS1_BALHA|nr:tetratricopeptide repeat protein [Balneicella halophila]PVX52501.1 tetratricopeptide repeat protein [Balneicella halophila]